MALALVHDQAAGSGQRPATGSEDLAKKRRKFRAYDTNKQREIKEQREARAYYHNFQWTEAEIKRLEWRGQPVITSNRISRKIDFLVGVEQRMRRDPKGYGRNPNDDQSAGLASAAIRFVCDANRWEQKASGGTRDGMMAGIGVVFVGIEDKGRGPEVCIKSVAADRFFYDPRSEQADFSDARYMGLSLWLDADEAKEMWPDHAAAFERYFEKDGGLSTFALEQDREQQWGDFEHRRVRVVEMWEQRSMTSGLMGSTALTPAHTVPMGGWYYCKFCGDIELEAGWSPYQGLDGEPDNPYVAWSPYVDHRGDRYGLVRNMKSIQDEVNHRRSKALHEINSRQMFVNLGKMAVDDIDKLRAEAAKTDGVIEFHGEWGRDFGFVDRQKELQGNLEMLMEAKSEIENYGPNPGLVGKGEGVDGASGRALLAQRDSGMTELQPVFDQNRDWKLRVYRKVWARIKQAWTTERWIRITDNPEAPQFVGINQWQVDPASGEIAGQNVIGQIDVDIILDEGPDTITLQEELFQTLSNLGEAAMGPVGRALIELSNLPNKERIIQILEQASQPPPDPMAEASMDQQLRGNEAKIEETRAKTAETLSRIETNRATAMKTETDAYMARVQPKQIAEYGGAPAGQ